MRKLVLVLSLVLAVATVMAQPYYMFITSGTTSYSTSANVDGNSDAIYGNGGADVINWIDTGTGNPMVAGILPTGEDIIVDANELVIDGNFAFNSIVVNGTPGGIVIGAGVTVNVATTFDVQGVISGGGVGTTINVGGPFTITPPGTNSLAVGTAGTTPIVVTPPPVPVSLWSIVLGAGLIAGFTIVNKRRKQVLV